MPAASEPTGRLPERLYLQSRSCARIGIGFGASGMIHSSCLYYHWRSRVESRFVIRNAKRRRMAIDIPSAPG